MRWLIAMTFITLGAVSGVADEPREWKEFAPKEGRFKVLMQGTPEQSKLDTESDFGKGVLNMNSIQVANTFYAANYTDYPVEIKKVNLKQIYDSSRDGAVANMQGKLASEKYIKLGEHPGREIQIYVQKVKMLFRARIYLIDQRLYQVVVFGTKEAATSKDADNFLDSFKLTEK